MRMEYSAPGKIIFGEATAIEAAFSARHYGEKVMLVTGMGQSEPGRMRDYLYAQGMQVEIFAVEREPTVEMVLAGISRTQINRTDVVIGFGGGSAIDTAKAIAVLSKNPGNPLDYLEVVGGGLAIQMPGIPMIAVPTTAGTGSEVTRNAVLGVPEKKMKVSLRSPFLLPVLAVIDPELTYTMPRALTASTGMDALTQVIEPFVSNRANLIADLYCREGMLRVGKALLTAYKEENNPSARINMSFASLMGGLALANAGLGAVHGFASPLGGMYDAPHGAICARLLAPVIKVNVKALQDRAPDQAALSRYAEAARLVTGSHTADESVLYTWCDAMSEEFQIPRLHALGVQETDFDEIIRKAASASSMKANPIQLTTDELREILAMAL